MGMLAAGSVVGSRFRVERPLGAGGMGDVYLAVQEPLGRRVALKVMRNRADADAIARFKNEARAVAALSCAHVVALYDFGDEVGAPYIAMELLQGVTLRERIKRAAHDSVDDVLQWMRDVACGLRMAHENGIVHRDLKPENIMLVRDRDRDGSLAKVLDFGIAKRRTSSSTAPETDATMKDRESNDHITGEGVVFGTPGYIAPELAVSGTSDARTDVYALGVVMFEALTHAAPYSAATSLGTLMAHVSKPVPDPRSVRNDIPDALAELVMQCMAKDPAERPVDGAALVVALDAQRAARTESFTPAALSTLQLGATQASGSAAAGAALSPSSGLVVDRPSIAVQPFLAVGAGGVGGGGSGPLGANDDDVVLAEGISEDILIALARFKELFVVAQSTMWQHGGRETDALRVGKTLGVRYVVGGSVRRAGDRLRISANLVDVTSGAQLWGQRFDRPFADVFAVQDEVTEAIVACVAGHIEKAQADFAKRKAPHALAAYEWLARGRALHHRRTLDDNKKARECMDQAVALDPDYAQAHAWRACVIGQTAFMTNTMQTARAQCRSSVETALSLDDTDSECHRLAAELALLDGNLALALHHHERGIALNPNDARIVGQRGEIALYEGDLALAASSLERAVRLDVLRPLPYMRHLAAVRYMQRDLDAAGRLLRNLDQTRADTHALGAAVAALRSPSHPEVAAAVARLRSIAPSWSLRLDWPRPFVAGVAELWREGFAAAGIA